MLNCNRSLTTVLVLASTSCFAQVSVNAGADVSVALSDSLALSAVVSGRASISCIKADGNNATEDSLVKFDSELGLSFIGPLKDAEGRTFGWPSDLVRVNGVIYGIDTLHQQLYTVDEVSGDVTPIGPPTGRARLGSLAYDPEIDAFYSVDFDQVGNELISIDRESGLATSLITNLPLYMVKGLAYDIESRMLYAYDQESEAIYTLDLTDGSTEFVVSPFHDRDGFYAELTFFNGDLYGPFDYFEGETGITQVRRIDLETGSVTDIGPPIVDVSVHSLILDSLPEEFSWSTLSGPGTVTFSQTDAAATSADFSELGVYELQFAAVGNGHTVSDTILVTVELEPGIDSVDTDPDEFDTPIAPASPSMCRAGVPGTITAMLLVVFSLRLRRRGHRSHRPR